MIDSAAATSAQSRRSVVVNGRFLSRRITGVERYAHEIMRRLPETPRILRQSRNRILGHLWEQCVLPFRAGNELLWSPCNTGPVFAKRHVVTLHDTGFVDEPQFYDWKFSAFYRRVIPILLSRVVHVITVSEFSKRQIIKHFGLDEGRVTAIPLAANGFAPATQERVSCVSVTHKLTAPYLLTVGSLKPGKNAHTLIQAWTRTGLAAQGIDLVVVGVREAVFAKYALDATPAGVRFLGYVGDEDLSALYTGALAFIFPSLYEGFGLPVLEAMACGTPVICSNATSLPEVAGDAALYVDPRDVDSIAMAMKTMVDSTALRTQLRERGTVRSQAFNWQRTAESTWKLLQSLLN